MGKKASEIIDSLDSIYERISAERRALGFVANHLDNDQAMCNLMVIHRGMLITENSLLSIMGRSASNEDTTDTY